MATSFKTGYNSPLYACTASTHPRLHLTCPAEHAKWRGVIPLTFLQRRSTLESTSAWATAQASTPGVLRPVDTPSSVKHTPSSGDDVLRWCLPGVAVATPPPPPPPVANGDVAAADAVGRRLNKAGESSPRPLPRVAPVVVPATSLLPLLLLLPPRALHGRDADSSSTKCIGGRAPGVQISTITSSTTHVDVASDVRRPLLLLLLLVPRCWF